MLTGVAAALFSPAVETGLAREGARPAGTSGVSRTELFALDATVSKVGALVGPVLGTSLLGVDFRASCVVAAAVFGMVFACTLAWGPREAADVRSERARGGHAWAVCGLLCLCSTVGCAALLRRTGLGR